MVERPGSPLQQAFPIATPAREPSPTPPDGAGRDLLRGCDREQVEAITTEATPLCIVAGAGSGKTRVLTRRIAWRIEQGTAAPAHVLALTFTRKAAGELRGRLAGLGIASGVAAGTFHALALAQLRQLAADAGRPLPVVLDSKARIVAALLGRGRSGAAVAEAAGEIEWAKSRLVGPAEYAERAAAAGRRTSAGAGALADVFERYERERRKRGVLDFEDLLTSLTRAITTDPDVAAAQQWRFRHFFVDEVQDLTAAQLRLLDAWLGGRDDLCVVGDPEQAIYGWNGAEPDVTRRLAARWPGMHTVHLGTNYRSTPQILSVAAGSGTPHRARAERPDGPIPSVTGHESDVAEADAVAAALRRAHAPGRRWSQLAVLARTNAQLELFEQACRDRLVPAAVAGEQTFLQRPAVRSFLAGAAGAAADAFRAAVADLDEAAAAAAANLPGARAAPDGDAGGGGGGGDEDDPDPPEAAAGEARERALDLGTLCRLCHDYLAVDSSGGGAGFAAWLRTTVRGEPGAADRDAVVLSTFHRAKGLEWPVVFVAGLERGFVPIAQAEDPASVAEERRLLYVALTRAEDELHCSWARTRRFGTTVARREPSPWLPAIEASARALRGLAAPATVREMAGAARSALAGGGPPAPADAADAALSEALRHWRAGVAKAANVPVYVVVPDRTVDAIVRRRPRTVAELLELPGIGPSRAAAYGDRVLDLVRESEG